MKKKDVMNLKPGNEINHKRYGLCEVHEVMLSLGDFFGVVIIPKTDQGEKRLAADSGTNLNRLLEDSIRRFDMQELGAREKEANGQG